MAEFHQTRPGEQFPPLLYFLVSAIFHYLGPAFAVMLFAQLTIQGVTWLRIASAAIVFALWRRPWRSIRLDGDVLALGIVLGLMNACFYEAISRLQLSTVGAIEFIGPILLAAAGARTARNGAALVLAAGGGWILTGVGFIGEPLGYLFAFANSALFMLYVVLGHRIARDGGNAGIDRMGMAMLIALVTVSPIGFSGAVPALQKLPLLSAGIGVGICSSVIPYVCDQLAMARLSRPTFALLLALLPASATLIGIFVLRQIPTFPEISGIVLIASGVVLHKERDAAITRSELTD